jgi:hypothetical protein
LQRGQITRKLLVYRVFRKLKFLRFQAIREHAWREDCVRNGLYGRKHTRSIPYRNNADTRLPRAAFDNSIARGSIVKIVSKAHASSDVERYAETKENRRHNNAQYSQQVTHESVKVAQQYGSVTTLLFFTAKHPFSPSRRLIAAQDFYARTQEMRPLLKIFACQSFLFPFSCFNISSQAQRRTLRSGVSLNIRFHTPIWKRREIRRMMFQGSVLAGDYLINKR